MKKTILAIVLLVCAGFVAFAIKDVLDAQNPLYAVPQLSVSADSSELPIETRISAYAWRLTFAGELSQKEIPVYEMGLEQNAAQLMGGEVLTLEFSRPPKTVRVSRSDVYSYTFNAVEDAEITVPFEEGAYIFQVYAIFDSGSVLYYFYVAV